MVIIIRAVVQCNLHHLRSRNRNKDLTAC